MQTLTERIAGLFVVGWAEDPPSDATAQSIAATAGAILFRRNIAAADATRAAIASFQVAAQRNAALPLLIAVDQEGGTVERLGAAGTPPPSAMALGAADDPTLTRAIYHMIGDQLASLGITLDFAPVADVNTEPSNPAIGLRSFGDDPRAVARHVAAAVSGLHDAGVAAAAKHFPGHGDTTTDSHTVLPVVGHDIARLRDVEFVPFRAAIDAGVDVIMTAHVALSRFSAEDVPATLSRSVLEGWLRDELRFDGVICTDDLSMQAIAARYTSADAAVRALDAGADLLLYSSPPESAHAPLEELCRALQDGRLAEVRVNASLARVNALRARYQSGAKQRVASTDAGPLVRDAARRAITLVRTTPSLPLPIATGTRVFIVNFVDGAREGNRNSSARVHSALAKSLVAAGANVTEQLRSPDLAGQEYKQLLMAAGSGDVLVAVTRRAFRHPLQAQAVADLALFGKPLAVVMALEPYDAAALPENIALIASFGDSDAALAAAADVLLGRAQASGRMPVRLPAHLDAASAT